MQLDWLDGLTADQCGQDHHHANLSQRQDSKKEKRTKGIYGLSGSISSDSLDLQQYLENRLAQQLIKDGSIKSKVIWNPVTTLAGRSLFQLQQSEPSTRDQDCGSWPTASARDYKGGYQGGRMRKGKLSVDTLDVAAQLADWLTPATSDMNGVRKLDGKRSGGLNTQATTLWGTPLANPANGTPEAFLQRKRKAVTKGAKMGISLTDIQMQAKSVLWPTVTAQDNIQMVGQYNKKTGTTLGGAVRQCDVKTEKSGPSQLNPLFSLWLMGYPTEWGSCVVRGTQLSLK